MSGMKIKSEPSEVVARLRNQTEYKFGYSHQPKSLPALKAQKRKYERGNNPCGNCQSHSHATCRPKLDGSLCSCSCPRAHNMREEFEAYQLKAELSGTEIPSIEQIAKPFAPKYEKRF